MRRLAFRKRLSNIINKKENYTLCQISLTSSSVTTIENMTVLHVVVVGIATMTSTMTTMMIEWTDTMTDVITDMMTEKTDALISINLLLYKCYKIVTISL